VTNVVIALVDAAALMQSGPALAELERIAGALREPVRVAVAGRVNAGKSTLVNALVGQLVAPTDVSECTKMVTWYRYGTPQRLEIVLRDGTRKPSRLRPGGVLPSEVGVDPAEVERLEVWLANETLRSLTLIDTPGLGSLNAEYSAATAELLATDQASAEATAVADAILFILNTDLKADEAHALRRFRESSGSLGGAAGNAIGILSKADTLGRGTTWWDTAGQVAKRLAEQLQDDVVSVLPLAGLIAQTAECAALTEDDAAALTELASLDEDALSLLLLSAQRFTDSESVVQADARHRLKQLLDLQGVAAAVEAVAEGASGASAIRGELAERSGIAAVRGLIASTFRGKGERMKIRTALAAIDRVCANPPPGADAGALRVLSDELVRLSGTELLHRLDEADALALLVAGGLTLPGDLAADIRRAATGATEAEQLGLPADASAAEVRAAAVAANARWRALLLAASPDQARVGRIMLRTFAIAYEQAGTS
jgi:GTPase SAR1 family protein